MAIMGNERCLRVMGSKCLLLLVKIVDGEVVLASLHTLNF